MLLATRNSVMSAAAACGANRMLASVPSAARADASSGSVMKRSCAGMPICGSTAQGAWMLQLG
jgi:hypothetical protein